MRVLLFALLLTGCGSACSSDSERRLPKPSSAEEVSGRPASGQTGAGKAASDKVEQQAPAPPPEPLDPDDERVVYISPSDRSKVRFAARGEVLLVADALGAARAGERLSLQDMFGQVAWEHDYARVDDLALDDEAAFATADGHLYRYALDSGEPQDLGEAQGQIVLTNSHVYTRHLGTVRRRPRKGGRAEVVMEHDSTAGFHRIAVADDRIAMLASAYRNRPARNPKLGWLLTAPASGGELKVRFRDMYSPGPSLVLDAGYAYFGASLSFEDFDYEIMRVPLEDRGAAEVVVHHPIAVFTVDGGAVYAAARLGERAGLFRFSVGDEEPVLISAFEGGATRIQLDGERIYWESRGRIYRVSRAEEEAGEGAAGDTAEASEKGAAEGAPAEAEDSAGASEKGAAEGAPAKAEEPAR